MSKQKAKEEFLLRCSEVIDFMIMEGAQNHKNWRGCYVGESWVELRGVSLGRITTMRQLTDEDRAAWFDWQVNRNRDWHLWGALERVSILADQRDADLMAEAQTWRKRRGKDFTLMLGAVLCGGALERFTALDELEAFL